MDAARDADNWARNADKMATGGLNVGGRKLTGPQQGFGQLWQKTYKIPIPGVEPERVISEWKAHYGEFWPRHSKFNAPVAGIQPGEVGGIQSMQVLSTGVMVLFSDSTSFAYMTPEGHPFAGWITFSSYREANPSLRGADTVAQVQLLIRANDPLWELAFVFGMGKGEDLMWQHTLRSLAAHFAVDARASASIVKVDRKRIWANAGNLRKNSAIGSFVNLLGAPARVLRRG